MNIITKVETPEADKYKEISKYLHAELVLLMCKTENHFFSECDYGIKSQNTSRGGALPEIFPTKPQDSMQVSLLSVLSALAVMEM